MHFRVKFCTSGSLSILINNSNLKKEELWMKGRKKGMEINCNTIDSPS